MIDHTEMESQEDVALRKYHEEKAQAARRQHEENEGLETEIARERAKMYRAIDAAAEYSRKHVASVSLERTLPELEGLIRDRARLFAVFVAPEATIKEIVTRAQAISFAYGNCKLDGSAVTEEQVAAAWDKSHYPFGLSMWTDDEEWCIAASADDAAKCYEEAMGETYKLGLAKNLEERAVWTEEPPGKLFRFNDDGTVITKTNAEWCRERGRGHFASANI